MTNRTILSDGCLLGTLISGESSTAVEYALTICSVQDRSCSFYSLDVQAQGVRQFSCSRNTAVLELGAGGVECNDGNPNVTSVCVCDLTATPVSCGAISVKSGVRNLLIRDRLLCVVTDVSVLVYGVPSLELIKRQETFSNPSGLCAWSTESPFPRCVLCCLGLQRGTVRIERFSSQSSVVAAHEAGIAGLAISGSGAFMATVSETGTVVRIHSTDFENPTLLFECRRSSILSPPKLRGLFLSPSGSFVGTIEGNSVNIYKTTLSVKSLLSATEPSDPTSLVGSLSSFVSKCIDVLHINHAWATVVLPEAEQLEDARFGSWTDMHALYVISKTRLFSFRFDPGSNGHVALVRSSEILSLGQKTDPQPDDDQEIDEWTILDEQRERSSSW